MHDLKETRVARLIEGIEHQGIGGKEIILEKEGTIAYALDTPFNEMTIGLYNFVIRRGDLIASTNENVKIYYGHVDGLGYFVAEDELIS